MEAANTNFAAVMLLNQTNSTISFNPANFMRDQGGINKFLTDSGAFLPDIATNFTQFDSTMDNFAFFKDMITTAENGISQMIQHGESIHSLIEKAKEEGITTETLDAIQKEVDSRIAEIQKIRDNTFFKGINPYDGSFSMNIPKWEELFKADEKEEEQEEGGIKDLIASFDIDMNIGAEGLNLGTKATVQIGYTEEGDLQITVDASMDFDLSALSKEGVSSNNAMDIINNFLALLTGKQNGLNSANNLFDNMFAQLSGNASIVGDGFKIDATNDINMEGDSSKNLKGQIVQHATITLDSTANQMPSIAINLL